MKSTRFWALLAVLGLLVAACGSGSSEDSSDASPEETQADEKETEEDIEEDEGNDEAAADSPYGVDFDPALKADEPYKIGVSLQQQKANFWVSVKSGSTDAATRADASDPVFNDANGEDDKQLNDVKNMIVGEIDGLVLGATNSASAVSIVEETAAEDIPVVAVALQVGDPEEVGGQYVHPDTIALVTNDDKDMGKKAASFVEQVAEEKGETLNIVILQGTPGTANATLRDEGFKEELESLGIDYEISNEQTGKFKREDAKVACDNMLASDDSIDLIYSHSDEMTIGCVTAMENADRTDIPVASIGGNEEGIELVSEGKVLGTVCQKPATMGAVATQILIRHLNGEEIKAEPFFYETPTITKDNLDDCAAEW